MNFIQQNIPDVILIEPKIHDDDRGYFVETFRKDEFMQAVGRHIEFIQDNESKSSKGVLRGLHFQLPPYAQSKLVRTIDGEVLDIAVDIRNGSSTFGRYVSAHLSGDNKHQLFIPRGFAHGFVVLSEVAILTYKVDNYYSPDNERGLAFDDSKLNIDWLLPKEQLILSNKDIEQPALDDIDHYFDCSVNYYE